MAAISLNKSSLQEQRHKLALFERYLPSLELKRLQLTAEHKKESRLLAEAVEGAERIERSLEGLVPLLGIANMRVPPLVRVRRADIDEEDVLGVRLPVFRGIEFDAMKYSLLATPFWFDALVTSLEEAATYRVRLDVQRERVARMQVAVRRITQRVNLFEKVLIPSARQNIARIQAFLSDMDRSAVVISKITKRKRAREVA
jgi:V/A-type H+-transporting ATPase subunit D